MNYWVDKHEIMRWCSIRPTTYKKRLKNIDPQYRRSVSRGKTEINIRKVYSYFCPNTPPLDEYRSILSYSHSVDWNLIGNIVPVSSLTLDLKNKMYFLFDSWLLKDKDVEVVYSIEQNPKDDYFHSHFLIKTSIPKPHIEKDILMVCDENNIRESRMFLRDFNPFVGSGVDYTLKEPSGGCGCLKMRK